MKCMVECTPIKILQLFCWAHDPWTILQSPTPLHLPLIASNLPIKLNLVARQWPTNMYIIITITFAQLSQPAAGDNKLGGA